MARRRFRGKGRPQRDRLESATVRYEADALGLSIAEIAARHKWQTEPTNRSGKLRCRTVENHLRFAAREADDPVVVGYLDTVRRAHETARFAFARLTPEFIARLRRRVYSMSTK